MKKKIFSIIFAIAMLACMIPFSMVTVSAAEPVCVQLWEGGPYWATSNLGVSEKAAFPEYGALYNLSDAEKAVAELGNGWRLPTKEDFDNLMNNCSENYEWNGITYTGNGDYSSNSIFLPFAGYGSRSDMRNSAGRSGIYLTSTKKHDTDVYTFRFTQGFSGMDYNKCDYYYSVLAVRNDPIATSIPVPTAKTDLVYNGDPQTGVAAGEGYTITDNVKTDAGTYTATVTLADGYIWADGTLTDKPIEWTIDKKAIDVPPITGEKDNMFLFTGKEIVALESSDYYTVENGSKTAAGGYTAKVTPTKNYKWATDFNGEIKWYIVNAEYYLTEAPTTTENGTYNQRAYYMDGDKKEIIKDKLLGEDQSIDFAGWYLRPMVQYKEVDGNYDIRFISMLNGGCFADGKLDDYESAGFIVNNGGDDIEIMTTVGYTSFLADGKEISIADYSNSTDFFFLVNTTFADIHVDTEIKVTPFVKLIDGETTLKGNTASFKLSQLIKK